MNSNEVSIVNIKEFLNWILRIRDDNASEANDGETTIEILDDLVIRDTHDPLSFIVSETCPSLLENVSNVTYLKNKAIVAPNMMQAMKLIIKCYP